MKYWLLTTEYPPFYGGGISTYCHFTAMMLAGKGIDVTVFINDATVKDIHTSHADGVRVIRFSPARTKSAAFLGHVTNISYEFAAIVKHFVEQEGPPDIVEAQEYLGIAYYLLQFKHLRYDWCKDIPVLITIHSPSFLYMEYNHVLRYAYPTYWIGEMERFCLQAADLLIAPSQFILNELKEKFQLNNAAVAVIPNPYQTDRPAPLLSPTGGAQEQIVFYGKLSVQKGVFRLLSYFRQLWDKGFTEPLYLIGGQEIVYHPLGKRMGDVIKSDYRKYIHKGLLRLEGPILPRDIEKRLSLAKLVIIPSYKDNLPYVAFEMMGMGKIVLVSRQGGQAEVVEDGINGFVFDHEQPETFFAQLEKILHLPGSEQQRIYRNAIQKIRTAYNPDEIYLKKMDAIKKLLARRTVAKQFPFVRQESTNVYSDDAWPAIAETEQLLSIVVPYYNMGEYIDETIASLRTVDYAPKEIIIVNDGSNESTSLEKLSAYRAAGDIRVIDTENKGLARARNFGAAQAKGQFLAFLDADDLVSPDYYSKAIRVLNWHENVFFAGAWTRYFGGSGKIWPTFMPEPPLILYHNLVNSSALVYKRRAFMAAGQNDPDMPFPGLEDYDSVIAMTQAGLKGVALPEPLFQYRVRRDSMIRKVSKAKKRYLLEYISLKHKVFYNRFATEIFNLQNANGSGAHLDNPTLDHHLSNYLPFAGRLSTRIISLIKRNDRLRSVAYRVYRMIKS